VNVRSFTLCATVAVLLPVAAQYPLVRTLSLRDGQRPINATTIAQDRSGSLWVGGGRGLYRTDGDRTEAMLRFERGGVTALHAAGDGVYAALSQGLVVRCDGMGCDTIWSDSVLIAAPVRSIQLGADGALWVGTYGAGVHVRRADGNVHLSGAYGLSDDHVNAMCLLDEGDVAIATDQGVTIADARGRVLGTYSELDGAPDNLVLSLAADTAGRLWCGTDKGGVFSFDTKTPRSSLQRLPYAGAMPPVTHLVLGSGQVWVGTEGQGTMVCDLRHGAAFYFAYTLEQGAGSRIAAMLLDQDGAVWWADGSPNLRRADGRVLMTPIHEGVDLRSVSAITRMDERRIAFAQDGMVYVHADQFSDAEVLLQVRLPVGNNTEVVALHPDARGDLWAGTFGAGVFRIHPDGRVEHLDGAHGGFQDNVLAIRARGDSTWFATLSGVQLHTHEADGREQLRTVPVPGSGFTYDVLPMPDGSVLVATDGNGVVRLRPGAAPQVLLDDARSHRTIYSLCLDAQGNAWACGPGTGVLRVGLQQLEEVLPVEATSITDVYAIAPFGNGLIVLGAEGLLAMDPLSGIVSDLTRAYDLEGVQASLNAATVDGSGAVWLATSKGLLRLGRAEGPLLPAVGTRILEVSQGGEQLDPASAIVLAPAQDFLTIRFTGIHYASPEDVRFAYRLVGADTTVRYTRDRELTFTHLRAGEYRFEVIAFTGTRPPAGPWARVIFTVPAPWWRRWWAIAALFMLVGMAAVVVVRTRENRLRLVQRMEEEKVRFQMQVLRSQVNPHFLFNSFNTLIGLIEEDPAQAVHHVEHLSDFFREILQVRDKELIPLHEELRMVRTYFQLEQRRFGDRIALQVEPQPASLDQLVPPLTVQLLVENALKHNRASADEPLVVSISSGRDSLTVSNPFRPRGDAQKSTGFGIGSIRQRFAVLTDREVRIGRSADNFVATIPLIPPTP
jgi:ligand-binding sensor domain-containing protein